VSDARGTAEAGLTVDTSPDADWPRICAASARCTRDRVFSCARAGDGRGASGSRPAVVLVNASISSNIGGRFERALTSAFCR